MCTTHTRQRRHCGTRPGPSLHALHMFCMHARCCNMRTAAACHAPLTRRHPRRQVNKQYKYGQLAILDVFTSMRIYHTSFAVYYNDIQGSTGATVYGNLVSFDQA